LTVLYSIFLKLILLFYI